MIFTSYVVWCDEPGCEEGFVYAAREGHISDLQGFMGRLLDTGWRLRERRVYCPDHARVEVKP